MVYEELFVILNHFVSYISCLSPEDGSSQLPKHCVLLNTGCWLTKSWWM